MPEDLKTDRTMSATTFHSACLEIFGTQYGWQTRVARALGTDRSSVSRWLSGTAPVPGPVRAAMRTWSRVGFEPEDSG